MGRPILEREREIAHLGTAASEATGGNGSVVLITGEAGIGKCGNSALLASRAACADDPQQSRRAD